MRISGDVGHGFAKFYDGTKGVLFPALLGEVQTQLMGRNGRREIKTDEGQWYIGATAKTQSISRIRGQDETWAFSPGYRAILLYGISEFVSTDTGKVVVDLVSGLPVVDYKRNRKDIIETLVGIHKVTRPNKRVLSVKIRNVAFLPQGFAPAQPFMEPGKKVATFDIGSRNINFTTFDNGELIDHQTDSSEHGSMQILADIAKRIEEQTKRRLHPLDVIKTLETKSTTAYGNSEDVSEIVDYHIGIYYEAIVTLIAEVWGNTADVDHLLIFGGGALLVGDRLTERYPQARVLDKPQWANAHAQFEYARRRFR